MATVKQGTYTPPPEWWKHLRPYNKRRVARAERIESKKDVQKQMASTQPSVE